MDEKRNADLSGPQATLDREERGEDRRAGQDAPHATTFRAAHDTQSLDYPLESPVMNDLSEVAYVDFVDYADQTDLVDEAVEADEAEEASAAGRGNLWRDFGAQMVAEARQRTANQSRGLETLGAAWQLGRERLEVARRRGKDVLAAASEYAQQAWSGYAQRPEWVSIHSGARHWAEALHESRLYPPQLKLSRRSLVWTTTLIILGTLLISLLLPAAGAVSALADYNQLKGLGESGLRHLLAAEQDLSGLTGSLKGKSGQGASATPTPTAQSSQAGAGGIAPDPKAVQAAQSELRAAQRDFQQLRDRLDRPDWVLATANAVPGFGAKLQEMRALVDVGMDVSTIGVEFADAALPVLTRLHGKSLSGTEELLTPADLEALQRAANHALTLLDDIQSKLAGVQMSDLPLSPKQKEQFAKLVAELPAIRSLATQAVPLLGAAGWLLGVGQPRHFLFQTLDKAELRPTGGFTGNYGVLTIHNGKIDPFELYNVNDIEYGYKTNGWIFGRRPPAQYSWWPFANWGLRDSNLSPDFPTSAKVITDVFKHETGVDVDGVIHFSPVVVQHMLKVTGPLYVPVFDDTVSADNLEDKIHYYEEDPAGIAKQHRLFPDDHTHSLRKRFTQAVTRLLEDRVRHLPQGEMLPLAKQLLKDLQTKDLQVYLTNQQLEGMLQQYRATGAVDTTAGVDGYFFVQTNVSVAKSTPYVDVTQHDEVWLDDQGGATHHLTITLRNAPRGNVFGLTTYRNYVRIYVPPQAQLKAADGFDTGVQMCAGASCSSRPYPDGELSCPAGQYLPGEQKSLVPAGARGGTLDRLGAPTARASDIPGRAMWGGYVVVPEWCTARLTLTWYVPNVASPSGAVPAYAGPYTMLVQRQSGTAYTVSLTIHPSPKMAASGTQTVSYTTQIAESLAFQLGEPGPIPAAQLFGASSFPNFA